MSRGFSFRPPSAEAWRAELERRAQIRADAARAEQVERSRLRMRTPRARVDLTPIIKMIGEKIGQPDWTYDKQWCYVSHLLQSYCSCGPDTGWRDEPGGWEFCAHAGDEGFS